MKVNAFKKIIRIRFFHTEMGNFIYIDNIYYF